MSAPALAPAPAPDSARYAREQSEQKPYCSSRSANVRRVFAEHGRAGGAKFEHARELFGRKFLCSNSCSASMLGERSAFLRSNSCSFPTVSLTSKLRRHPSRVVYINKFQIELLYPLV